MFSKIKVLFLLALSCFLLVTAFFFFSNAKLSFPDAHLFSLVGGSITKYSGPVTLTHRSDNTSQIAAASSSFILDSSPLYFQSQKKLLLPQSMAVVLYNQSKKLFKLNFFSSIAQVDNRLLIEDRSFSTHRSNFFLFDGNDTYVFFEPTTISFGNQSLTLPPFSFITSIYNNKLSVFNFETALYNEFPIKGLQVFAHLEHSNSIDLNTDTLVSGLHEQVLLIKQIQDLKNLE